jgi:hypothetical protein
MATQELPYGLKDTLTIIISAYNTAAKANDTRVMEETVDLIKSMLSDPRVDAKDRAPYANALINPSKYGITEPVPGPMKDLAVSFLVTRWKKVLTGWGLGIIEGFQVHIIIRAAEDELKPWEESTRAQFSRLYPQIQHLYNEKVSRSEADRKDFEKQRGTIFERITDAILAGHAPPSDDLMIFDAIDHPDKYGLKVVGGARPPGRPPKHAAAGGGSTVAQTRTVTTGKGIQEEISKRITEARGRPAHIPENMPPELKQRILTLDKIRKTNDVAWKAAVQSLLYDVARAYKANPDTYMTTDAARMLGAFQISVTPNFLAMLAH